MEALVSHLSQSFTDGFIKSKGIASVTTWSKRIGGSVVVLVGIYLFYLGVTL